MKNKSELIYSLDGESDKYLSTLITQGATKYLLILLVFQQHLSQLVYYPK